MSSSIPLQIAETIQTASIKRNPSPAHDINPSTAASRKEPVQFAHQPPLSDSSVEKYAYDEDDAIDEDEEEDIPYSVLKPAPRRTSFGPLPDLRFEQSYLASIAGADSNWKVLYITARDQVCLDSPWAGLLKHTS
jgi:Autophagy receptor ATG43